MRLSPHICQNGCYLKRQEIKEMKKMEPSYTDSGSIVQSLWKILVQSLWKRVWKLFKKVKIELPYDLVILPLGI